MRYPLQCARFQIYPTIRLNIYKQCISCTGLADGVHAMPTLRAAIDLPQEYASVVEARAVLCGQLHYVLTCTTAVTVVQRVLFEN